jgi:hypothetical protein
MKNAKVIFPLIVFSIVALPIVAIKLGEYTQTPRDEERFKQLSLEYLNPTYSDEYRQYWQINDYAGHKKALRQSFDLAQNKATEVAYGVDTSEKRYFFCCE